MPYLIACASGLGDVYRLRPPPPTKLVFTTPPQTLTAGACSTAMRVQTQDAAGAPTLVLAPTAIALSTSTSSGSFFLDEACTSPATAGTVTVATGGTDSSAFYYEDTAPGSATVTASSPSLTPAEQTQTVVAGAPNRLQFTVQPRNLLAGGILPDVKVSMLDGNGAVIPSGAFAVSLSISGSATLSGGTTVNTLNGVATFAGLSIDLAGRYSLTASAPGATSATSAPFEVLSEQMTISPPSVRPSCGCQGNGAALPAFALAAAWMLMRRRARRSSLCGIKVNPAV